MGIPWTQAKVVNKPDNPLPVSPLGVDSFFATRTGILSPGSGETTLISVNLPSVVEILEVATSAANAARIRILARKPSGAYENLTMMNGSGSGALSMVPSQINTHGSALFDITAFDTASSTFKFVLNRPLAFPNGFMMTLSNQSAVDANVGASVYGRQLR